MTNAAAIGYMILASKKIGLDPATISHLEIMMYGMMDVKTAKEAENAYHNN